MSWNAGYVSEVEYTHYYYRELNPDLMRLACLAAGIVPPDTRALRYLELGFGQGLSTNLHSAAQPGEFWGNDFNPAQAANARALAAASGSGAMLVDDSFADLAARPDLPEFDIIALHGIWTWVSEESRRVIVDLIRRKLRVGGLVYISYNCFPGWAPSIPLRHLIKLHASIGGSGDAGFLGRLEEALNFAGKVVGAGANYFRDHPTVVERFEKIRAENRNYIAHEYMNADWAVMAFSDVAAALDAAKLSFATSGNLLDHVDAINLRPDGRKLLGEIQNPIMRETVRDYLTSQQFRKDLFVKGVRRLSSVEQIDALRKESVVLTVMPDEVPMTVTTPGGEASLQPSIYEPLLEALAARAHAPKRLEELMDQLAPKSISWQQLVQAILVLAGAAWVEPAREPGAEQIRTCRNLNRHFCERSRGHKESYFLASPVTGGGIPVDRFGQLFLLAEEHGRSSVADQASFVWDILFAQGERLIKDGKPLQEPDENMSELVRLITLFRERRMPILKAVGIV